MHLLEKISKDIVFDAIVDCFALEQDRISAVSSYDNLSGFLLPMAKVFPSRIDLYFHFHQ